MSSISGDGRRRLADAVKNRRALLRLAMDALPHGPGEATMRAIEHAEDKLYRRRTLLDLDRSLAWKPGTSLRILDGTAPEDLDEWALQERVLCIPHHGSALKPHGEELRRLLLAVGVGTKWKLRDLQRQSGGLVTRDTWQSMIEDTLYWPVETLRAAADALRALGEAITVEELERAMFADLGHTSAPSRDPVSELKARERAVRVAAIQELTQSLVADEPTDQHLESSRAVRTASNPRE
ncbi:MAG: hypothetical protein ACRDSH_19750 [Pseudonocardiaceae bacterium]